MGLRARIEETKSYEPNYECTIVEILGRLKCIIYRCRGEVCTGTTDVNLRLVEGKK